jgi:hypothetical protein
MKTFNDIVFRTGSPLFGKESLKSFTEFDNGYGVSVIRSQWSYGGEKGLYELAIFKDGSICYDTHIADDVLGYLSRDEVTFHMQQIQELSK